jgi:hypothetical protein
MCQTHCTIWILFTFNLINNTSTFPDTWVMWHMTHHKTKSITILYTAVPILINKRYQNWILLNNKRFKSPKLNIDLKLILIDKNKVKSLFIKKMCLLLTFLIDAVNKWISKLIARATEQMMKEKDERYLYIIAFPISNNLFFLCI